MFSNGRWRSLVPLSGGSCAEVFVATLPDGAKEVVKRYQHQALAEAEVRGLSLIDQSATIRVPLVIHSDASEIILEYIPQSLKLGDQYWDQFGSKLAALHQTTASSYGLDSDNFIGLSPQRNLPEIASGDRAWSEFFFTYRIDFQLTLIAKSYGPNDPVIAQVRKAESFIRKVLLEAEEQPCLVHGDLWRGNLLCAETGEPVLIDPAVYYGHREADFGMMSLFGGFPPQFFRAYHATYPLQEGWEQRVWIYELYHLLVHYNLFGGSYGERALALVKTKQG